MLSRFRLPGPTPLPPAVLAAMQQEMIPHRSAEFRTMYTVLLERLRTIHRTDHDVLLWPGSGSAGWEIAIANLFDPGDEVVAVITGYFGKRFAEVAEIYGLTIHRLEIPWGQAARPSELESVLAEHPQTKAVFLTHNETSTGVENPVAALAEIARSHRTLTLVDAVSSLGGIAAGDRCLGSRFRDVRFSESLDVSTGSGGGRGRTTDLVRDRSRNRELTSSGI